MRASRTRLSFAAVAAVAVVATTGWLAVGTATAAPTPYDPEVYTEVKAPTSIPSDATEAEGGVKWTPLMRNTLEDDYSDVTLTIDLASADEGVDTQLAVTSSDDRCRLDGDTVTCHLDKLEAGYEVKFALRLHVVDAESWKLNPVTYFDAAMTGGAQDTATDSTYIFDVRYDDVERVDFVMPEIIPPEAQQGTEGLPVRFEISNDIGQQLDSVTFTVDIKGVLGKDPSSVIGSESEECAATTDYRLVCTVDMLAAGFSRTFEATIWAGDNFEDNYTSEVSAVISWAPDGDASHTFAQRTEYANISAF